MADTLNARAAALSFHSTTFGIVDHLGQPWLKANEIAQALGYADESAINRIYARRSDEFTDTMTCSVKLTDQIQTREVRIFSLRGAHLLAMFARTAVAKEFRAWVLDLLEQRTDDNAPQRDVHLVEHAHQLAHAATLQVYQAVFDAVMLEGEAPHSTRMLLSFTCGAGGAMNPYVQPIEAGAMVMTLAQLTQAVRTDLIVSDTTLARLAAACTQRMATRAELQALQQTQSGQTAQPAQPARQGRLQLQ